MAHLVKCIYCGERFDRDKEEYASVGARRYAHAACALKNYKNDPTAVKPEVIDPLDKVQCIYCKTILSKQDSNCIMISENKYAHKLCAEQEAKRTLTDKEKLERYIMNMFKEDYINPRIQKQINQYIKDYNYTYSGMLKALIYFFEVKQNPIEKANGGIGIIPYIYKDAYNYYYAIWEAQQKNENKDLSCYIPQLVEIRISSPERKIKKRKVFTFLDEEEEI